MLKFVAAVVLVLLVGSPGPSSGGMLPGRHHDSKYFLFYIYDKAAEQCYGREMVRNFELELREIFARCYLEESTPKEALLKYSRKRSDLLTRTTANDLRFGDQKTKLAKDTPFYSKYVVHALKNDVFMNVRVVSCLFKNLELSVDFDGKVDATAYLKRFTENKNIPDDVAGFLVEGINSCASNSDFGDSMKWGHDFEDFFKLLKFFRCAQLQKIFACMKADLQKDGADYDLSGLDGALDDVDDIGKRYFVASSYANWDSTGLWDH